MHTAHSEFYIKWEHEKQSPYSSWTILGLSAYWGDRHADYISRIAVICSSKCRLFWRITPSSLALETWATSLMGTGERKCLMLGGGIHFLWILINVLFNMAHCLICWNSCTMSISKLAGTNKLVGQSSAKLHNKFTLNRRTDGQTDKSNAYCPFPTVKGIIKSTVTGYRKSKRSFRLVAHNPLWSQMN